MTLDEIRKLAEIEAQHASPGSLRTLASFAIAVIDALEDEWRAYGGGGRACQIINDIRDGITKRLK